MWTAKPAASGRSIYSGNKAANLSSQFLLAWRLAITCFARRSLRYIVPCPQAAVPRIFPNASTLKSQVRAQTSWPAERHQWPGMTRKVPRWTSSTICEIIPWSPQISTRFAAMRLAMVILQSLQTQLKLNHQVRDLSRIKYLRKPRLEDY